MPCRIIGCRGPELSSGFCKKHYFQQWRGGRTMGPKVERYRKKLHRIRTPLPEEHVRRVRFLHIWVSDVELDRVYQFVRDMKASESEEMKRMRYLAQHGEAPKGE